MAADDLTKPLGLPSARDSRRRAKRFGFLAAAIAVLALGGGGLWYVVARDGSGSTAVARIEGQSAAKDPETTGSIANGPATLSPAGAGPAALTDVTPDGGVAPVGDQTVVIHDPSVAAPIRLASAPREDLVENSPYGLLPRIGNDGARPMDVYARPAPVVTPAMRRIAIVVGGIGISADTTEAALDQLPGDVTLAFAPYGNDLPRVLAQARAGGHEVLLQLPLEPFNYPKTNPGPKTLTIDAPASENIDRLHWLMSRITTYVGVVNYMGALFTSDPSVLKPVLADIGSRGLFYLDDGSSARSRVKEAAGGTPILRADVILDADNDPAALDQRLNQLSAIADERGYAIGFASAFPTSIDHITAFIRKARQQGVTFVPLSSLVQSGRT